MKSKMNDDEIVNLIRNDLASFGIKARVELYERIDWWQTALNFMTTSDSIYAAVSVAYCVAAVPILIAMINAFRSNTGV